ncbi:ABC transporter permease [Candidatus Omnitrophota bacterium]
MSNSIVTYEPDNSLKRGHLSIFREIINELRYNKWLTFQLFKRDFFGIYKQSFVGVFWAFIMPLFSVGTFIVLNRSGIFNIGNIDIPYPLYALLGMSFWQIFATGVSTGANSLSMARDMITKINFSKKSLVIASLGKPMLIFLIQSILVGILFIIYRITPNIGILWIPLLIIPMILLVLGVGFILSIANSFIRDVGNGLSVLITFLMFLTPILYVKPKIGILMHISKFNPLYYIISAARDLVLKGSISEPKGFIFSVAVALVIFLVSLFMFHLTETRITERM